MGHGITAILLGGNIEQLLIFSNGSGLLQPSGSIMFGNVGIALVSAGGLLAPPLFGAWFIISSRNYKDSHYTLIFLGLILIGSVMFWVRSTFGVVAVILWALAILWLCFNTSKLVQGFCVQFLGVQAGISSFHQIDYMFMNEAVVNGERFTSDTGQIAKQLFLPHWFWAFVIIAITFWLLYTSFRIAYKDEIPKTITEKK